MSKNNKQEGKATPFFARFLEAQQDQSNIAPYETLKYPSDNEDIQTRKYPSDWEDC